MKAVIREFEIREFEIRELERKKENDKTPPPAQDWGLTNKANPVCFRFCLMALKKV